MQMSSKSDLQTLAYLAKTMPTEDLNKAIDKSKLMLVDVVVNGKNGPYHAKRWVASDSDVAKKYSQNKGAPIDAAEAEGKGGSLKQTTKTATTKDGKKVTTKTWTKKTSDGGSLKQTTKTATTKDGKKVTTKTWTKNGGVDDAIDHFSRNLDAYDAGGLDRDRDRDFDRNDDSIDRDRFDRNYDPFDGDSRVDDAIDHFSRNFDDYGPAGDLDRDRDRFDRDYEHNVDEDSRFDHYVDEDEDETYANEGDEEREERLTELYNQAESKAGEWVTEQTIALNRMVDEGILTNDQATEIGYSLSDKHQEIGGALEDGFADMAEDYSDVAAMCTKDYAVKMAVGMTGQDFNSVKDIIGSISRTDVVNYGQHFGATDMYGPYNYQYRSDSSYNYPKW